MQPSRRCRAGLCVIEAGHDVTEWPLVPVLAAARAEPPRARASASWPTSRRDTGGRRKRGRETRVEQIRTPREAAGARPRPHPSAQAARRDAREDGDPRRCAARSRSSRRCGRARRRRTTPSTPPCASARTRRCCSTQKMEDEQAKLMSGDVTNPKEVANISRELDALRKHKEQLEYATRSPRWRSARRPPSRSAKVDAAIAEGKRREGVLVKDFQAKGGALTAEIARLEAERALVAAARRPGAARAVRAAARDEARHRARRAARRDVLGVPRRAAVEQGRRRSRPGRRIGVCPACHRLLVVTPKDARVSRFVLRTDGGARGNPGPGRRGVRARRRPTGETLVRRRPVPRRDHQQRRGVRGAAVGAARRDRAGRAPADRVLRQRADGAAAQRRVPREERGPQAALRRGVQADRAGSATCASCTCGARRTRRPTRWRTRRWTAAVSSATRPRAAASDFEQGTLFG